MCVLQKKMPRSLQTLDDNAMLHLFIFLGFYGMMSLGKVSHFFKEKTEKYFVRYVVDGAVITTNGGPFVEQQRFNLPWEFCCAVPRSRWLLSPMDIETLLTNQLDRISNDRTIQRIADNIVADYRRRNGVHTGTVAVKLKWRNICSNRLFLRLLEEITNANV